MTIPAIVNVGIGYVTRDTPAERTSEFITYRDYVGVSTALLLFVALAAPDVVCPDRRQHVLPLIFARPLTGVDYVLAKVGAITTILFAFSFLPQVVLFVGNMLVSDSALDYFTGNSTCSGRCRSRSSCSPCTTRAIGVAISSLTDSPHRRRASRSSACSRHVDRHRHHRRRRQSATARRRSRSSTCSRCRCTSATSSSSATSIPSGPLGGVDDGGLLAVIVYVVVLVAAFASCSSATGSSTHEHARPSRPTGDPGASSDRRHRRGRATSRCGSARRSRCPS